MKKIQLVFTIVLATKNPTKFIISCSKKIHNPTCKSNFIFILNYKQNEGKTIQITKSISLAERVNDKRTIT
jgi:predicted P-loop ATPase